MKGGTNERTDGRTDEQKSPCVLQDFVPFGAAAQKEKREKKTEKKREEKREKKSALSQACSRKEKKRKKA